MFQYPTFYGNALNSSANSSIDGQTPLLKSTDHHGNNLHIPFTDEPLIIKNMESKNPIRNLTSDFMMNETFMSNNGKHLEDGSMGFETEKNGLGPMTRTRKQRNNLALSTNNYAGLKPARCERRLQKSFSDSDLFSNVLNQEDQ